MFEEPHRTVKSAVTTVVGGIEAGDDGRYRHGLAALAVGLIMLSAGASPAVASSLRRLASGTVAFSSDGTRFVAWQNRGDEQIVVFDTLTEVERPQRLQRRRSKMRCARATRCRNASDAPPRGKDYLPESRRRDRSAATAASHQCETGEGFAARVRGGGGRVRCASSRV
jgi:hypothetical protein